MALKQQLEKVGLPQRWSDILKEKLGIFTIKGKDCVGVELYPFLVRFVNKHHEKSALRTFLQFEGFMYECALKHDIRFLKVKSELAQSLESLKKFHAAGKYRQDVDVTAVENYCREILQIPKCLWFREEFVLIHVVEKIDGMMKSMSVCESENFNDVTFIQEVSGCFSFNTTSTSLNGIFVKGDSFDLCTSNIIKAPGDIKLCLPLLPQFWEVKQFNSRAEENQFFDNLSVNGCSKKCGNYYGSSSPTVETELYCSTVKYCFVPMTSCYFKKNKIVLSDQALSYLSKIDNNIAANLSTEKECCNFLKKFGSHCFQGHLHFGGIYICKSSTASFDKSDKVEDIKKIQIEAIDAQICMSFPQCNEETCIADLEGVSGQPRLKNKTYIKVTVIGGQSGVVGFPDWKISLSGSNITWKMIDCGSARLAVWDVIRNNHRHHFKDVQLIVTELIKFWDKLCLETSINSSSQQLEKLFLARKKEVGWLEPLLNALLNKRREVERQTCDPKAWALEYLPQFHEYITSAIQDCHEDGMKSILRQIVEPMDLSIFQIFPAASKKIILGKIYDSENDPPLVSSVDFINFGRYLKQAIEMMNAITCHQYHLSTVISFVECAVDLLSSHLHQTGQLYEQCLLLTIFHCFNYNQKEGKFFDVLSERDMKLLNDNFRAWAHEFFRLEQENEVKKQAYLFYLTTDVSYVFDAPQDSIKTHIIFLKQSFAVQPEIIQILEDEQETDLLLKMRSLFQDGPEPFTMRPGISNMFLTTIKHPLSQPNMQPVKPESMIVTTNETFQNGEMSNLVEDLTHCDTPEAELTTSGHHLPTKPEAPLEEVEPEESSPKTPEEVCNVPSSPYIDEEHGASTLDHSLSKPNVSVETAEVSIESVVLDKEAPPNRENPIFVEDLTHRETSEAELTTSDHHLLSKPEAPLEEVEPEESSQITHEDVSNAPLSPHIDEEHSAPILNHLLSKPNVSVETAEVSIESVVPDKETLPNGENTTFVEDSTHRETSEAELTTSDHHLLRKHEAPLEEVEPEESSPKTLDKVCNAPSSPHIDEEHGASTLDHSLSKPNVSVETAEVSIESVVLDQETPPNGEIFHELSDHPLSESPTSAEFTANDAPFSTPETSLHGVEPGEITPNYSLEGGSLNVDELYDPPKTLLSQLLQKIGLSDYFPQKLSTQDAIQVRDDTLKPSPSSISVLYPFLMLQKIMAFDSKCRLEFGITELSDVGDSDSFADSYSDEDENSIHPISCLLALILCSDNLLRQDIFCRLSACQIAVPLLLPHPSPDDPMLMMWAMRSIVKEFKMPVNEFKMPEGKTCRTRIITHPTPFVSFMRIGKHSISKSEILNGVMSDVESDVKSSAFIGYNSPGGTNSKVIMNGLIEVSWYLPGDGVFPTPIAFTNLRGDASDPELNKQVEFISNASTVTVVLLSLKVFQEDGAINSGIKLFQQLAAAPGGIIVLLSKSNKAFKSYLSSCVGEELCKSKISIINCERSANLYLKSIQSKLRIKLDTVQEDPQSLEVVAKTCKISVDEDNVDCMRGKQLMENVYAIVNEFRNSNGNKSLKDLLPLQSEGLWHTWAALSKEQFRQKKKNKHETRKKEGQRMIEWTPSEYGREQRKRMNEIRRKQYPLAKQSTGLIHLFLDTLRKEERNVLHYYLIWLKFRLDDLSRDILPPFYVQIREKRKELSDIQQKRDYVAEKICQEELKELDTQLIKASFGHEHIMREVGQVYEAISEQGEANDLDLITDLPMIAAQLLYDGFPLELLDGDASHIPTKWISSIFTSLAQLLKANHGFDPKVYVLSVLGVQSTGKSTLLNTVFGVQFSVSAGRCTRGAFMQLIPVNPSLHEEIRAHYFLLIDTEGLRAPELDRLEGREHDNELATFVIGMANLTLINVAGEVSGEMDDILHTVVHAFLRMNQVQLQPSCHIVHQHVVAIGADEKMMQGRLKTKDNLDKMTKAAAKETGVESQYTHFKDIIKFDHERDVSFFPSLWSGIPPMARVSNNYSEVAQKLKLNITKCCKATTKHSIPELRKHLENLWKAILQEDFVFTFQNTFEIVAFKTLERKYGDWSWDFKRDMSEWEQMAEKRIHGCLPKNLDKTHAFLLRSLLEFTLKKFTEYEALMLEFFDEPNNKIMLKWKPDIQPRLQLLRAKLERHAEDHISQVYQAQRDRAEADNEKSKLNTTILGYIQQLISTIHKGEELMTDDKLEELFEEQWGQWMMELTSRIKCLPVIDVAKEAELCVINEFQSQHRKMLIDKLGDKFSGKPLREFGIRLALTVRECHIKVLPVRYAFGLLKHTPNSANFIPKAEQYTKATLSAVESHLKSVRRSDRNFSQQLVTELLHLLQEKIPKSTKGFQFTDEYDVDIALTSCGYAITFFEKMAEEFRKKHDPKEYVEKEMKSQFKNIFLKMYKKIDNEKIVADTLCAQLEEPINEFILERVTILIVQDMRGKYPFIKDKQSFIANILLQIGRKLKNPETSEDGFKLCRRFLTNVKSSIEIWSEELLETHCDSGSLSHIALSELDDKISSLCAEVKSVTSSLPSDQLSISTWMKKFNTEAIEGKLKVSLLKHQMYTESQEFTDVHFFTKEVTSGLDKLHEKLKQYFSKMKYKSVTKRGNIHKLIFEGVAGCTAQCPFCKAQCELTIPNHSTKHTTHHRPRCLGGFEKVISHTMVLDICTHDVSPDSEVTFRTEESKWEPHPYKNYQKLYPNWTIAADKSLEASLYWKWFIGNFTDDVQGIYDYSPTEIPDEWKEVKWTDVEDWLTKEYHL